MVKVIVLSTYRIIYRKIHKEGIEMITAHHTSRLFYNNKAFKKR